MNTINVGDRVEDLNFHKGMTGAVVEIHRGTSMQDHGFIYVQLDKQWIGVFPCRPKDMEHYVEFEWWKTLRKI